MAIVRLQDIIVFSFFFLRTTREGNIKPGNLRIAIQAPGVYSTRSRDTC